MASYVMSLSTDEDAFLEETQNLVLKMLGLDPSELKFDNDDDYEGEESKRNVKNAHLMKASSMNSQHYRCIAQKLSMLSDSVDDDLETDESAVPLPQAKVSSIETSTFSSTEPSEEERRIEAAVEKLEKMAEQILLKYKDDFEALEVDLEDNASYSSFSSFMGKIIPSPNPIWYKICMLFGVSRYLVKKDKKKKSKNILGITSFTVDYIKDNFADYIIENGGWDSVASVSIQEIEGDMFCEMPDLEKAAFENFPPSNDAKTNETTADGKIKEKDDGEVQGDGDSKEVVGSSIYELSPFIITASAAAAVAVAYAVMKT